jgi:signal peptidase II
MVGVGLAVIAADQLTKRWIVDYFQVPEQGRIPIFGRVLELIYVQNTGVAFSLFQGQTLLYVLIALAVLVIGSLYWRMRDTGSLLLKVTFGLILGGAIGNLLDRFAHAYVVDFIHFQIPGVFDYPVFNLADSAICVGVVLLAFLLWRGVPAGGGVPAAPTAPSAAGVPTAAETSANAADGDGASSGGVSGRTNPTPRVRNPHARAR